jgi:hypothetical protein
VGTSACNLICLESTAWHFYHCAKEVGNLALQTLFHTLMFVFNDFALV